MAYSTLGLCARLIGTAGAVAAALGFSEVHAAEPIKIGFGMALTGGLAANGKSALVAMKIWESDVNAAGGLFGRPVQLDMPPYAYGYLQVLAEAVTATKSLDQE